VGGVALSAVRIRIDLNQIEIGVMNVGGECSAVVAESFQTDADAAGGRLLGSSRKRSGIWEPDESREEGDKNVASLDTNVESRKVSRFASKAAAEHMRHLIKG
jgi:hypothetical protein